jgi:imidazoleglycerol-phosphate dehydratase
MNELKRDTKETKIQANLEIYGSGKYDISTNIGFFDHMLESFTKHSLFDLNLCCNGDTHVDFHHSVEDCAIVIGKLINKELFPIQSIERFGECTVVMDEAAVEAVCDISNRPYLHFEVDIDGKVGDFDIELVEEFFRAFTINASITLHVVLKRGKNRHHIIEAVFKSVAVALRRAIKKNDGISVPSTKGIL